MAAKSKKRLSLQNKLQKLEKLELNDVICTICQSILIEPVTLPCFHVFCHNCFNGSIENNALCCPLCRLRIGSWLRKTKRRNLVNTELWKCIQTKFSEEINTKLKGEDVVFPETPETKPSLRLSTPGEIRFEYEAELKRLREERICLENKHLEETQLLIQKIRKEEEEAHKKYLEAMKRDEIIARKMQGKLIKHTVPPNTTQKLNIRSCTKPRLKDTKIDGYLSKLKKPPQNSPLLTDDNTSSTDGSTHIAPIKQLDGANSPEMVPSYGKIIKNLIEKKNKLLPGFWNKENGDKVKEKKEESKVSNTEKGLCIYEDSDKPKIMKKPSQSLLVSLPLPNNGLLQNRIIGPELRKETGSVDSMRQELCYFKPIEEITTTCYSSGKGLPIRVPVNRVRAKPSSPTFEPTPTRSQYLQSLKKLRHLSIVKNLPSAFVIALKALQVESQTCVSNSSTKQPKKLKKHLSTSPSAVPSKPVRRNPNRNKQIQQTRSTVKPTKSISLQRTRSMGSISKNENETTPKKAKVLERKAVSDKKPSLRSNSKRVHRKESVSPPEYGEMLNNNKINVAVKKLSSPLKNCDVKHILQEQLRIEKIIEQEKKDLELAREVEAQWNGRRPTRAVVKRQVTLTYALRPAKKLKV